MEKFYIYKKTSINNQINDKCTVKQNIVFDTLIMKDTHTAHIILKNRFLRTYLSHKYYTPTHLNNHSANNIVSTNAYL